jgi:hypothetical protein
VRAALTVSQSLEAADVLPVGDGGLERRELDIGGVHVMIDDRVAERPARERGAIEQITGLT